MKSSGSIWKRYQNPSQTPLFPRHWPRKRLQNLRNQIPRAVNLLPTREILVLIVIPHGRHHDSSLPSARRRFFSTLMNTSLRHLNKKSSSSLSLHLQLHSKRHALHQGRPRKYCHRYRSNLQSRPCHHRVVSSARLAPTRSSQWPYIAAGAQLHLEAYVNKNVIVLRLECSSQSEKST